VLKSYIRFSRYTLVALYVFVCLFVGQWVSAAPKKLEVSETRERTVDSAALSSQVESIRRLRQLVQKNRGKAEEPLLLERLGEAEQDAAAIEFRIIHGPQARKQGSVDLTSYRTYLRSSISTLRDLISRFPSSKEIARYHLMLAKAYENIGKRTKSEKEYQLLVTHYPRSPEVSAALLSIADMAIAARDYARAIRYLVEIEKRDDDPRYPFALHRLAWAWYNLKQPGKALAYLEKTADASRDALRELALLDVPLFYLEGREQKLPQYASDLAPSYFRSLDQGPVLGKMLIHYSKLLRAHSHAVDLIAFKNALVESAPERPETFEVVTIVFEYQLNQRRFEQLAASANEIAALQKQVKNREALERAQKLLLDSAAEVQKLISKNRNVDGVEKLNQSLADIYGAFTRLVGESDPRLAKVHYNLAESLFSTRQWDLATSHYLWLVKNSGSDASIKDEAAQKAIASRYEGLRARGLLPKDLKARALSSSPSGTSAKMDDYATEWVDWVDARQKQDITAKNEAFYFEASRMIYASGEVSRAVDKLSDFALKNRSSKYSQPSAALVLDTYVASSDWRELQKLISKYLEVSEWRGSPLHQRLTRLDSEVAYKKLEATYAAGDYSEALVLSENYLKSNPETGNNKVNSNGVLILAGNAALALKDQAKARKFLSRLIAVSPHTEAGAAALLTRGGIQEAAFEFENAAKDYQEWFMLPDRLKPAAGKTKSALRGRILTLWWVSNNPGRLQQALQNPQICTSEAAITCDRFRALGLLLGSDRGKEGTLRAFYRSRKAPMENRPIWAALALEGARTLVFRDRNVALHHLMANWKSVDPLFQTYLVSSLSRSIPETFRLNRRAIPDVAPLMLSESYMGYRMEILREFENIAAKVSLLPWARVRAAVLNEVASAYLDVSSGLKHRAAKKNIQLDTVKLVMPFEDKGQKLRTNAFKIASDAAVEEEQFDTILAPFMQSNPGQAKELKHDRVRRPRALDQFALEILDPENNWRRALQAQVCSTPGRCAIAKFGAAIRAGDWAQVAYLVHESHDKRLLGEAQLGLVRCAAFSAMGAQAEGLKELAAVSNQLNGEFRKKSSVYLLVHYFRSLSKQMTREMLERLRRSGGGSPTNESEGTIDVASAAEKWIGG